MSKTSIEWTEQTWNQGGTPGCEGWDMTNRRDFLGLLAATPFVAPAVAKEMVSATETKTLSVGMGMAPGEWIGITPRAARMEDFRRGIRTLNEVREIEGLPPIVATNLDFCGDSSLVEHGVRLQGGGSIPTSPLQLRKQDWNVSVCDIDVAARLVIQEHYSRGTSNTATYLHGPYPANWSWHEQCVGVAWWMPPTKSAAQAWAGNHWEGVLALSRLAIRPEVPSNAASFLISKSVRIIDRERWHTLVSYADNWRGHTGAIYLAAGWEYCGDTKPEPTYTINGRMTARKAGPKTRTHAAMIALGAKFEGKFSKARFCLRAATKECSA